MIDLGYVVWTDFDDQGQRQITPKTDVVARYLEAKGVEYSITLPIHIAEAWASFLDDGSRKTNV